MDHFRHSLRISAKSVKKSGYGQSWIKNRSENVPVPYWLEFENPNILKNHAISMADIVHMKH
jgi:hypothetical protein